MDLAFSKIDNEMFKFEKSFDKSNNANEETQEKDSASSTSNLYSFRDQMVIDLVAIKKNLNSLVSHNDECKCVDLTNDETKRFVDCFDDELPICAFDLFLQVTRLQKGNSHESKQSAIFDAIKSMNMGKRERATLLLFKR